VKISTKLQKFISAENQIAQQLLLDDGMSYPSSKLTRATI